MSGPRLDRQAVERAAALVSLRLPRGPHRGRTGEVRAHSVGASMELHDFRLYQPGDDVRHLDWNAAARTGELVLRVRQEEVSPRVEVVLDTSASMSVSPEKSARSREVALLLCLAAQRAGHEASLFTVGGRGRVVRGHDAGTALEALALDGKEPFPEALRRAPALRPCGLRVWVSDLLFESDVAGLARRLAQGARGLAVVQVLDEEDLEPSGGAGARLTDAESQESLERILTRGVLDDYQRRLRAHLALWDEGLRTVRATLMRVSAAQGVDALARRELVPLWEAA